MGGLGAGRPMDHRSRRRACSAARGPHPAGVPVDIVHEGLMGTAPGALSFSVTASRSSQFRGHTGGERLHFSTSCALSGGQVYSRARCGSCETVNAQTYITRMGGTRDRSNIYPSTRRGCASPPCGPPMPTAMLFALISRSTQHHPGDQRGWKNRGLGNINAIFPSARHDHGNAGGSEDRGADDFPVYREGITEAVWGAFHRNRSTAGAFSAIAKALGVSGGRRSATFSTRAGLTTQGGGPRGKTAGNISRAACEEQGGPKPATSRGARLSLDHRLIITRISGLLG